MDKTELLDRYYQNFIDLEKPKDFFIGMADYLEYADAVSEFEQVSAEILAEPEPLRKRLAELEKVAIAGLKKQHAAIVKYCAKNKVKDERIVQLLSEFNGWETGKITSTMGIPAGMLINMHDTIAHLYGMPEHKKFASTYIEISTIEGRGTFGRYKQPDGYADWHDLHDELDRGTENALWGQVSHIAWLYDVIKHGREQQRKLKEQAAQGVPRAEYNAFNYGHILWEWNQVSEKKLFATNRDFVHFKIEKVRPGLKRLHLKLLTRGVLGVPSTAPQTKTNKVLTTTTGKAIPVTFQPRIIVEAGAGLLQVFKQTKKHRIGGTDTRRFKLVRCLFSPDGIEAAVHQPVLQNYERVFDAIKLPKDERNSKLKSIATAQAEKLAIIKSTIKEFQKSKEVPAGAYLKFVWEGNGVRMEVVPQEG